MAPASSICTYRATSKSYTLSLHDALPIFDLSVQGKLLRAIEERTVRRVGSVRERKVDVRIVAATRSEEHTSELQSRLHLVCRLLREKKKRTPPARHRAMGSRRTPASRQGQ